MNRLLLLLLLCYFSGHAQLSYDRARRDPQFSKRNNSIEALYKGRHGKNGRNDFLLFNFLQISRGTNGWPGGEGPCLEVKVSGIPSGDSAILYVQITGGDEPAHYFVNPRHGKITIYSGGGTGGEAGTRNDGSDRKGFDGGMGGDGGVGGMMGASGPPVYIKDVNGQVLKLATDLKY